MAVRIARPEDAMETGDLTIFLDSFTPGSTLWLRAKGGTHEPHRSICRRIPVPRRTEVIRLQRMNNTDVWHWACCDADLAPIPKPGKHR
ncbi:DUF6555 family protein [Pseudomonas protegens]|uniref:DUF6555 family protein n=1 Tax=Pseudomonas protegens TaxID=380021 RepID=UPI0034CE2526